MHVLLIDDSRAIRKILARILTDLNYTVVEAANGKEALDKLHEQSNVDLCLVDWNMPEMNGLEFVQAVRADHAYDAMRLMMVTTETEIEQMSKALEAGANEYVMKPFTKDALAQKLELLMMS